MYFIFKNNFNFYFHIYTIYIYMFRVGELFSFLEIIYLGVDCNAIVEVGKRMLTTRAVA